ncbi:hypothetical protein F5148DRAFT_1380334 [Russula earlei]|uniref:Uncharacterized protein n=1 Tax=Russula earlei TaxID=71964 RepID=A0ACC0TSF7_9AGAM|nr:hypothetical protein F5148DRAFT_1380334 [Russula earlei]
MSRLEILHLGFRYELYPESRPPPALTRSVHPALFLLEFKGVHEYLEDLLAQIDVPLLKYLDIIFSRANLYHVLPRPQLRQSSYEFSELKLEIRCRELDWQLGSLDQVRSSIFSFLTALLHLDIVGHVPKPHWKGGDMDTTEWLELLDLFTSVEDLRLSDQIAQGVCQALEELTGERVTEVLPALQNIFLKGLEPLESVPKYIEGFVAARKISGHPVAVHRWG